MTVFILDSNIVSYYLKCHNQVIINMRDPLTRGDKILMSPLAYYEVKRGLVAINATKQLVEFTAFYDEFGVGLLDNSILEAAVDVYVELRRKGCIVEDADILIAAFCKSNGFTLVTNNTKHFGNISGLHLTNWV